MSVLDQNGLGDWVADRLVEIGELVEDKLATRIDTSKDPFLDERLDYRTLSIDPKTVTATNPISGEQKEVEIKMFEEPGVAKGSRRAISEIVKYPEPFSPMKYYYYYSWTLLHQFAQILLTFGFSVDSFYDALQSYALNLEDVIPSSSLSLHQIFN